jgi:glutamine synthetase
VSPNKNNTALVRIQLGYEELISFNIDFVAVDSAAKLYLTIARILYRWYGIVEHI